MKQDNQINLYNTEDITRMSRPVDSGRWPQSHGMADHLAKRIDLGSLLDSERLALKLQLAQKSGISRGTIWCTAHPKRCSDSFGLNRAQETSQRFSMPHPCSVRLKIRLCRPRWPTSPSDPPAIVKYLSSHRKFVRNNRPIQAKQKTEAQWPA